MQSLEQQTPEWHEFRRHHIGASDACVIAEVSPWKTPLDLWQEKIGLVESTESNDAMKRGLALEPFARNEFIKETGIQVSPVVMTHPTIPWMAASLDGYNPKGIAVEIKCSGLKDHQLALNGEVPPHYIPQLHHQIEVAGLDEIYYFSYRPESTATIVVKRNDTFIRRLIEMEQEFWDCVCQLKPPPLTSRDYIARHDPDWIETALQYKIAKMHLQSYEKQAEELKQKLINLCDGQNCIGEGVKVLSVASQGRIAYSKIPELKDTDLEKYRGKPSKYWRTEVD